MLSIPWLIKLVSLKSLWLMEVGLGPIGKFNFICAKLDRVFANVVFIIPKYKGSIRPADALIIMG